MNGGAECCLKRPQLIVAMQVQTNMWATRMKEGPQVSVLDCQQSVNTQEIVEKYHSSLAMLVVNPDNEHHGIIHCYCAECTSICYFIETFLRVWRAQ